MKNLTTLQKLAAAAIVAAAVWYFFIRKKKSDDVEVDFDPQGNAPTDVPAPPPPPTDNGTTLIINPVTLATPNSNQYQNQTYSRQQGWTVNYSVRQNANTNLERVVNAVLYVTSATYAGAVAKAQTATRAAYPQPADFITINNITPVLGRN